MYSACVNSYDEVVDSCISVRDADHFWISDDARVAPTGWKAISIKGVYRDPRRTAKVFKILPHLLFSKYEVSIWIDANRILMTDISALASRYLSNANIAMFRHNKRDNVLEEARECARRGKDDRFVIERQIERYMRFGEGPIKSWGLYSGCFIIRRHNDPEVIRLMESWWREIDKNSVRDQISFPYVRAKLGVNVAVIPGDSNDNPYFATSTHRKSRVYGAGIEGHLRKLLADLQSAMLRLARLFYDR